LKVLGIDPGTRHLGWGVLEQDGTRVVHVAHGVIDTDTTAPLASRLVEIDDALAHVLEVHRPDVAAVEALFFAKDAQAAAKLGHARGVVLLRLARARVPVAEMPPARVKRAVVGGGLATKDQVARVITTILRLPAAPRADAADALANAFAHLTMSRFTEALEAAGARLPPARTRARSRPRVR
jgi:crossover junction endodeoxyribonuclease RuvC